MHAKAKGENISRSHKWNIRNEKEDFLSLQIDREGQLSTQLNFFCPRARWAIFLFEMSDLTRPAQATGGLCFLGLSRAPGKTNSNLRYVGPPRFTQTLFAPVMKCMEWFCSGVAYSFFLSLLLRLEVAVKGWSSLFFSLFFTLSLSLSAKANNNNRWTWVTAKDSLALEKTTTLLR